MSEHHCSEKPDHAHSYIEYDSANNDWWIISDDDDWYCFPVMFCPWCGAGLLRDEGE